MAAASSADGTLTLLSLNCYLLPPVAVNQQNATCTHQDERAQMIGSLVCDPSLHIHVATFQEVWGGNSAWYLQAMLATTGVRPLPEHVAWRSNSVDIASRWLTSAGGLFIAHKEDMQLYWSEKDVYEVSNTSSHKGASACLLDVSPYVGRKLLLLVVTTHLDPTNENASQERQLQQLASFVQRCALRAAATLVETLPEGTTEQHLACVVTGDMNIEEWTPLYQRALSQAMQWRDLAAECAATQGQQPQPTYGLNSLAHHAERTRIDYIFGVDRASELRLARVEAVTVAVPSQDAGQELSDHCPQIAVLRFSPHKQ
eukprot:TRINITY_DN6593_c0_g1_i1.p1 TRINITY_DN6593_c0_g1~~TRINITY_DN6593_c0_g1_i1.p1  ORF type:complete len:327 (+),score=84.36 TRINITY_DN6593_c0_g1_i1:39-983(+)